jgi:hypothetical protein
MKIMEFLQESNGQFSATRLGFLLYIIGTVAQLGFCAYRGVPFAPTDNAVWMLMGLMGGKVVQKFGEKPQQ